MFKRFPLLMLALLALFASGCGSDDSATVATGAESSTQPVDDDNDYVPDNPVSNDAPIPVEPDGGIGDGAGPIPGFEEEPSDEGTWHGEIVAETNCPGTTWTRVQASVFSFSVPTDFVDDEPQGVDSEVGRWVGPSGIDVSYDYGWYSGSIAMTPGAEVTAVEYSGRIGEHVVVRMSQSNAESNMVGVLFPEVEIEYDEWNRLGLVVMHEDPNDEIIGRCIVGSIEWNT